MYTRPTPADWSSDSNGDLTIESLETLLQEFKPEPILGAVLVVDGYAGATLELVPGDFTGWHVLESIIGAEGVEICRGMLGSKVIIFSATRFDAMLNWGYDAGLVDVGLLDSSGRAIFGVPIYRITYSYL